MLRAAAPLPLLLVVSLCHCDFPTSSTGIESWRPRWSFGIVVRRLKAPLLPLQVVAACRGGPQIAAGSHADFL